MATTNKVVLRDKATWASWFVLFRNTAVQFYVWDFVNPKEEDAPDPTRAYCLLTLAEYKAAKQRELDKAYLDALAKY